MTQRSPRRKSPPGTDGDIPRGLRGIRLADEAGAKQLCLFHHDPSHDDNFMDMLAADANDARPGTITAREGQIIDL